MSDIKLFQIQNGDVQELEGQSVAVEKSLQALIEKHLEAFLGIRNTPPAKPTAAG